MAAHTGKDMCGICLNVFQQPVMIDCQHSFCFVCLEDYVNKTSTNGQFICPRCRCLRFTPKLNIEENSVINTPQCDVSRYDEKQIYQQSNQPKKEKSPVRHLKDFCPNHEGKKVEIYCTDCLLAVCLNCLVTGHNGHNLLDLQKVEVRKTIRQDLTTLNDDLEKQITNFQKHYDNLNSNLMEFTNCIKTECDKVDAQVDKICSEIRKIGENIKKEMQKSSDQEESKFGKLMSEIKRLTEDLKASVEYSVNVLEDSSIVKVLQRLPKARQEKDESCCRKLDIPDVRYSTFQVAELDSTVLSNQLGKIVSFHQSMIGKAGSCNQIIMFEDIFSADTAGNGFCHYGKQHEVSIGKAGSCNQIIMFEDIFSADTAGNGSCHYGKQHEVSGFTWSTCVYRDSSLLDIVLYLKNVKDKIITSCNVDVTYKVINRTDDRQSVAEQCNVTVKPGGVSNLSIDIIDWKTLCNPVSGFIDDRRNFTIQVTINKITDIKRRQ